MKLETTLTGIAGEYYVAAELTIRQFVAAVTLRNSRGMDIIASAADGSRSYSIQVKSSCNSVPSWILSAKSENFCSDTHFYVFVRLKDYTVRPDYYIVPSEVVARTIREDHQSWLSESKKDGSARKDTSMRKFTDHDNVYLERWDLIQ